jgi:diadenosine tetraphosphatase ApaH/serine/threonine PP2A family protein phosphatase
LACLPNLVCSIGNTDNYVLGRYRPNPTRAEAAQNPNLWPKVLEVENGIAWIQGCLEHSGWLPWLAQLPLELRMTLPSGQALLGVHASPGRDEGLGFRPYMTDDELERMVNGASEQLIVVGHTHVSMERRIFGQHLVNLGCIGMPTLPDLRASYALLQADSYGYQLQLRQVEYDRQAVIAAFERSSNPSKGYMQAFYRGELPCIWERNGLPYPRP